MEIDEYIKENDIKVGHDAEFYLVDKNGVPRSAIGKIGGSKDSPKKTKHGWVQEDNVNSEVNIPPASSAEEFILYTQGVMNDLDNIIKKFGLQIKIGASIEFDDIELQDLMAREAGCVEDYNAYKLIENDTPDLSGTNLRSCGGHIHLSWKGAGDPYEAAAVARASDVFITLPSLLLDNDDRRRSLYGKAGSFRPKEYGVEIRSPSNFWTRSVELMRWVFNGAILSHMNKDMDVDSSVPDIINTNNKKLAKQFILDMNIPMPIAY